MKGIKLNAQVMIKNLRNMRERSPFRPRRGALKNEDGTAQSIRTGPACKVGDHTQADATTA